MLRAYDPLTMEQEPRDHWSVRLSATADDGSTPEAEPAGRS